MKILKQIGVIFAFSYAGEVLAYILPVTVPSSVLGMMLLLAALRSGILKPEWIGETADFLSANMAFFFLPVAVNILESYSLFAGAMVRLLIVCVTSTLLTFGATYLTCRTIRNIQQKRRHA